MKNLQSPKTGSFLAAAGATALLLTGCAGGGGEVTPSITGEPTSYDSLEELRDLYVEAGGECPEWEELDPGDWDAEAGRCSDQVVITIYHDTSQIDEVVASAIGLMTPTHLLVGENWIINTAEPENFVDALGGSVISD